MRILLDECLPRKLAPLLTGHEVKTVGQMSWNGIENGELLALASQQFEVLITVDRNLSYQQNLDKFPIRLLVLHARSNQLGHLRRLVPQVLDKLATGWPGPLAHVGT